MFVIFYVSLLKTFQECWTVAGNHLPVGFVQQDLQYSLHIHPLGSDLVFAVLLKDTLTCTQEYWSCEMHDGKSPFRSTSWWYTRSFYFFSYFINSNNCTFSTTELMNARLWISELLTSTWMHQMNTSQSHNFNIIKPDMMTCTILQYAFYALIVSCRRGVTPGMLM